MIFSSSIQRLYAHNANDDALHLLATAHMSKGNYSKAIALLKVFFLHDENPASLGSEHFQGTTNANCLFLLATSLFNNGDPLAAARVLVDSKLQVIPELRSNAAAHHLLGQVYKVSGRVVLYIVQHIPQVQV